MDDKILCNLFFIKLLDLEEIFKNKFILFIYFWLRWVFVAVRGLFSSRGERGLLFVAVASLVVEHGL